MSRIDMHPEELLHRYRRQQLTVEERERLRLHCESCTVCDLERRMADDFASALAVTELDQAAAARAMSNLGLDESVGAEGKRERFWVEAFGHEAGDERAQPSLGTKRSWRRTAKLLAVGTLLVASSSAALYQVVKVFDERPKATRPQPPLQERNETQQAEPVVPVEPVATPAESRPVALVPPNAHKTKRKKDSAASAEELFRRGNEAARRRNFGDARQAYQALLRRFSASREAQTARVLLARVLTNGGRGGSRTGLTKALPLLDTYLRTTPKGNLAPEARHMRMQVLMRMGRRDEAARACRDIIALDGSSPYVREARRVQKLLRGTE